MSYASRAAMRAFQIVFFCCLCLLSPVQDGYFKTFYVHVRNKCRVFSLVEKTNCIIGFARHSSEGEGSDQYWWPARVGWAGVQQDKLKKNGHEGLEQLQLIGSDLREKNMGVLNGSFVLGA